MVDTADDIDVQWLAGAKRVGVTAGASAPKVLVDDVLKKLREAGASRVVEMDGELENVRFSVPKALLET
jgi:4-hydroxy-3-methylbut-2-en-1-yl diphosphate reductase